MSDRPQGGGGKRRNTNAQQRREEAEAEDDEVVEAGTFQRASQEKLRKRRIVSVSGRFKSKSTPQMQAPPALDAGTKPTVAAKPKQGYVAMEGIGAGAKGAGIFANVKLTAPPPAPGQKSSGLSFPKPAGGNPFASFISAPAPAPTAPSSAFGGGSSFLASPSNATKPMAETPIIKSSADKLEACNRAFLKWVRRQAQNKPATPWTAGVRDYLAHVAKLESSAPVAAPSAPAASKPFAFPAAPAPAPASKPFSFGAPAKPEAAPKPAFNFGAPPPKADAPKPAFSFGAAPPSTSAFNFGGAPAPAPSSKEDDAMPKEERVAVAKADDGDETTAFESRCALRRYDKPEGEKPQWRDLGKGQLRITRHKTTGAARVVVRNDVGKVVLNFALSEKMSLVKTKAGVAVTAATADGPKQYLLRTREPLEASHLAPAKLE
ncbi:unnamed protein product [Pelagomonas calceolata]|uniref:RanBD1 domain-containing protein n=1 Tax=Pelagomonas calceolata TaxID=35677 RepID=A0A8J2SJ80_9STRA|nr:unnamed protein product [Pelagomonas calceolata]|mmetsp:Transcript_26104/g.73226  ORF Transcript_26104/g.73226 Transcript_26104/m.73226 type:complete len:434 (+) Transcript_26104:174-1475(+)